jgi:hypothetical protein
LQLPPNLVANIGANEFGVDTKIPIFGKQLLAFY